MHFRKKPSVSRPIFFMPLLNDILNLSDQLFLVGHVLHIPGCKNVVRQTAQCILRCDTILFRADQLALIDSFS